LPYFAKEGEVGHESDECGTLKALHLHVAGRRLVLERQEDAVAELRGLGSKIPKSRSLVKELLAERRLAAATE
jgi:hypothetical protein